MGKLRIITLLGVGAGMTVAGCGGAADPECVKDLRDVRAGDSGSALVFQGDPIAASGRADLSPEASDLDSFREGVALERLSGKGVLSGRYVDVRNGRCPEGYLAFNADNRHEYSRSDPRFQEAMSYYYGDRYRALLDSLDPASASPYPIQVIAHCMTGENAFYLRSNDRFGHVNERVCIGDSTVTPGASYADDAAVVVHELQHASTVNFYSRTQEMGAFKYDEAGVINEAISDFMALAHLAPEVPRGIDPRMFGRWALGRFLPSQNNARGAYACPMYDPAFPDCELPPAGTRAFARGIRYVYPDGLGWPLEDNFKGYPDLTGDAPALARMFRQFRGQEEIHTAGILLTGALWEMHEGLRANRGGSHARAFAESSRLVHEAVRQLPRPVERSVLQSPVTLPGFAQALVDAARMLGLSEADREVVRRALVGRGLLETARLPEDWLVAGRAGEASIAFEDDPGTLRKWARMLLEGQAAPGGVGGAADLIPNAGAHPGEPDPGEVVAAWFDLVDVARATAGGPLLTIRSENPGATFLGERFNRGYVSSDVVQVRYFKVNGLDAAESLRERGLGEMAGNSYFFTNPQFRALPTTAVWLRLAPELKDKTLDFTVEVAPTNGPAQTVRFHARAR